MLGINWSIENGCWLKIYMQSNRTWMISRHNSNACSTDRGTNLHIKTFQNRRKKKQESPYEPSSNTKTHSIHSTFHMAGPAEWRPTQSHATSMGVYSTPPHKFISFPTRQHDFFQKSNLSIITLNSINEEEKSGPFRLCHDGWLRSRWTSAHRRVLRA